MYTAKWAPNASDLTVRLNLSACKPDWEVQDDLATDLAHVLQQFPSIVRLTLFCSALDFQFVEDVGARIAGRMTSLEEVVIEFEDSRWNDSDSDDLDKALEFDYHLRNALSRWKLHNDKLRQFIYRWGDATTCTIPGPTVLGLDTVANSGEDRSSKSSLATATSPSSLHFHLPTPLNPAENRQRAGHAVPHGLVHSLVASWSSTTPGHAVVLGRLADTGVITFLSRHPPCRHPCKDSNRDVMCTFGATRQVPEIAFHISVFGAANSSSKQSRSLAAVSVMVLSLVNIFKKRTKERSWSGTHRSLRMHESDEGGSNVIEYCCAGGTLDLGQRPTLVGGPARISNSNSTGREVRPPWTGPRVIRSRRSNFVDGQVLPKTKPRSGGFGRRVGRIDEHGVQTDHRHSFELNVTCSGTLGHPIEEDNTAQCRPTLRTRKTGDTVRVEGGVEE
ncbi:hypothetical protein DFH06DRAFT_1135981 [Mycena polygramma]|nr:hypothetical protein DFH06DRAFT_1135981 [Mycena polygramma]